MNIKTKLALATAAIVGFFQPAMAFATVIDVKTGVATTWTITNLGKVIGGLLQAIFLIAGILVFVFLVWGGIQWLTSGGDSASTQKARDRITAALVGLAIIAIAYALVTIVGPWFGLTDVLNLTLPTLTG